MDFHLKQWKQQSEDHRPQQQEEQQPAKLPKLLLQPHPQQLPPPNHNTNANSRRMKDHPPPAPPPLSSSAGSTLPLFVPDHPDLHHPTNLSSSSSSPSPRMGSYFSLTQWQELELQALIYRYMLSGAAVPPELLHSIKKSLAHRSPPPFLQQNHPHLSYFLQHPQSQPFTYDVCRSPVEFAGFQSGYWGSASMDPEPGRCRRTDGKKWRCSRDAVLGQKYCERHVHRGRNRSRKPVEISPTNASQGLVPGIANPKSYTGSVTVASSLGSVTDGSHFAISGPSRPPIDLFQMNNSPSNFGARSEPNGSQVLRHFFDDWPRTLQEPDVGSLTGLSMSIGRSSSSDVSLKLSTRDGESDRTRGSNWLTGWSSPSRVAPVGGPLAEALTSTTTADHLSPTSVLHRLPCGLAAETGLVTQI